MSSKVLYLASVPLSGQHRCWQGGVGVLPGLLVMGSSEALLSGQRPPFRLLVRARLINEGVLVQHIQHAVSDNFVVRGQSPDRGSRQALHACCPGTEQGLVPTQGQAHTSWLITCLHAWPLRSCNPDGDSHRLPPWAS